MVVIQEAALRCTPKLRNSLRKYIAVSSSFRSRTSTGLPADEACHNSCAVPGSHVEQLPLVHVVGLCLLQIEPSRRVPPTSHNCDDSPCFTSPCAVVVD